MSGQVPGELPFGEGPGALERLEEQLRRAAGVPARIAGGAVELSPATLHEVARAQAARSLLGPGEARVRIDLSAFDRIEPPDPKTCALRVGGSACVADVESSLRAFSLTLGSLTPRARTLTVRDWLTGPHAGLRPIPGNRLETAALSLTAALAGGGVYRSHPSPRSAVGPMLDALFLGAGEQAGLLVEATLRALPSPGAQESVHAWVERPEEVVVLLRSALQAGVTLAEVQIARQARGYALDLAFASPAFRARRDRAALEKLVAGRGELKAVRRIYDRELPFEGELAWDRLASAVAQHAPLGLYRLARESTVVAALGAVQGARPLDEPPAPLPEPLLRALGRRAPPPAKEPS
jgi:FAD/FMN-containing dehydrogenase